MRYDVYTLAGLKSAVDECTNGDRIVIFFPNSEPCRFRVFGPDDKFQWHACNKQGDIGGSAE